MRDEKREQRRCHVGDVRSWLAFLLLRIRVYRKER